MIHPLSLYSYLSKTQKALMEAFRGIHCLTNLGEPSKKTYIFRGDLKISEISVLKKTVFVHEEKKLTFLLICLLSPPSPPPRANGLSGHVR